MASKVVTRGWGILISLAALISPAGTGCGKSAHSNSAPARDDAGGSSAAQDGRGEGGNSESGGRAGTAGVSTIGGTSGIGGDETRSVGGNAGTAAEDSGEHAPGSGTGGSGADGALGGQGFGGAAGSPVDGNRCDPSLADPCFEPCGGDPSGVWLIEDTCFDGNGFADRCPGAFIAGTSVASDMQIRIVESRLIEIESTDRWNFRANLPPECLGVNNTSHCALTELYVEPLLTSFVSGLGCKESACGDCECSGTLFGEPVAYTPLEIEASMLKFDAMEVPYCVQGDTLWLGGGGVDGKPKVSYKFRKRSCTGPTCAELTDDQCMGSPCRYDGGGCEGSYPPCSFHWCEAEIGCSWGPPQARCGYELGDTSVDPAACVALSVEDCHSVPGCIIDW